MKVNGLTKTFAVGALSLALVGCGDPSIDGSSVGSYRNSVDVVMQDMTQQERAMFAMSLKAIETGVRFENLGGSRQQLTEAFLDVVDGKTAKQIVSM